MKVEIYSKNDCPQCEGVKTALKGRSVEYVEYNRDESENPQEITDFLKSRGIKMFPYVVVSEIDGEDDFAFSGGPASNMSSIRKIIELHQNEKVDADTDTWDF